MSPRDWPDGCADHRSFLLVPARLTGGSRKGVDDAGVEALNANAGGALSASERDRLVADLAGGAKTRAAVLRAVAEDTDFTRAEFNRALVLMQYFGYLKRDPNALPDASFDGYDFWLSKLNQFDGDFVRAEMVRAFISSVEYRRRFGQP